MAATKTLIPCGCLGTASLCPRSALQQDVHRRALGITVDEGGWNITPISNAHFHQRLYREINMEVQCIWDAIKLAADEVMEKKDKAALACLFGPVPDDVL
uniref:Uncharacterized protein n=1 Tax=Oryza meridionalis TaxID=40149 RepID=A0A0E0EPJ0_9ORYZ